jgi:hypothetical protein
MNAASTTTTTFASAATSAATSIAAAAQVIQVAQQGLGPSGVVSGGGFSTTPGITPGTGSGPLSIGGGSTSTTATLAAALIGSGPGGSSINPYDYFSNPNNLFNGTENPNVYQPGTNASTTPIQINMNYPQFNSQQQSSKVMNDVVTMLRTVPSLKL